MYPVVMNTTIGTMMICFNDKRIDGRLIFSVLLFLGILIPSCTTVTYQQVHPALVDKKYDSEFPYKNCSEQLEHITESIRMVSCIAYYQNYIFPLEAKIGKSNLHDPLLMEKAVKNQFINRSSSGTATVVYSENRRIALLTCAHIIEFPDTIITYYREVAKTTSEFIYSIALKERQSIYSAIVPGTRDLDVLAVDRGNDLALIGQRFEDKPVLGIPAFDYPVGKAKELEWGAFVYIFGYPMGYRLITKAIVSSPNRDQYGSFLTDAVLNKGFSGGVVLAIRDGVPNFELVGIIKLIPGHQQFYLAPTKQDESIEYEPDIPYRGDTYIESRTDVNYGVALTVPAELIVEFLRKNRSVLLNKGYDLQSFLERQPAAK